MSDSNTHDHSPGRGLQRLVFGSGVAFVATGCLFNEWLLGRMLSPDGTINDPVDLTILRVCQSVALIWGAANLALWQRSIAARLNLLAVTLVLISPLAAEVLFRVGIAAGIDSFRDPGLYTYSMGDDDFWKLRYLWLDRERAGPPSHRFDEQLGWTHITSPANPLGVVADRAPEIDYAQPTVLFFGDSFVESATDHPGRLPQQLDRMMPDVPVLNLGVSGYGVGQVMLRMKSNSPRFDDPTIMFGILTSNLDRSVQTIRGRPKPWFRVVDDQLVLHGPPLPESVEDWIQENPVSLRSFFWGFLKTRYRLHQPGAYREISFRRDEKQQLNRALLKESLRYAREQGQRIVFVVFYDSDELTGPCWRGDFLRTELERLDAPYIDTLPLLTSAAKRESREPLSYYRPDHHLNEDGNRVVAEGIVQYLDAQ